MPDSPLPTPSRSLTILKIVFYVLAVNSRTKVCQGFAATLRQQFSATLHHLQGVCK